MDTALKCRFVVCSTLQNTDASQTVNGPLDNYKMICFDANINGKVRHGSAQSHSI